MRWWWDENRGAPGVLGVPGVAGALGVSPSDSAIFPFLILSSFHTQLSLSLSHSLSEEITVKLFYENINGIYIYKHTQPSYT